MFIRRLSIFLFANFLIFNSILSAQQPPTAQPSASPAPQSGTNELMSYTEFMSRFDTNKNNQIDLEEQLIVDMWFEQKWREYFATLLPEQQQLILKRFDKNKNGMIETEEWHELDKEYQKTWLVRYEQLTPEKKALIINHYDVNRNGRIDGQEYRIIPLASKPVVQQVRVVTQPPTQKTADIPQVLAEERGAEYKFSNLFKAIRRFSLVIILIGTVLAGVLFVLQKPQWAIAVFAAAIIIGGGPTVIELIYTALR